jgi:indole-3-glycerol phosphate synthase
MPDLLAAIVAATETSVAHRVARRPRAVLETEIAAVDVRGRGFRSALTRTDRINIIAECKRRSPARGVLRADYDPAAIAQSYETAGAAAISVLTEPTFFDGALEHLAAVRDAVALPLLRKDFIVDEYQCLEARLAGADAVLLIVAALTQPRLRSLLTCAHALGLDALVEVHDEDELERAMAVDADLIGVNNRNLRTMEVDIAASRRMAAAIPRDVVAVAESGLRTAADLRELRALGFRAFLIGERFMAAADPGAALREVLA